MDGNVGFPDAELFRELRVTGLAPKRFAQARAQARQLLGAAPDGRHVALAVDDHDVAGDPRLVAVRIRVVEKNLREHARILRIAHVENGRAEPLLVRDVADVGVIPGHRHLPRAGEVQVREAGDVASEVLGGAVHWSSAGRVAGFYQGSLAARTQATRFGRLVDFVYDIEPCP